MSKKEMKSTQKEIKNIRSEMSVIRKKMMPAQERVGKHGQGREVEYVKQLMLPEAKSTPVLAPSLTPALLATGTGYVAATSEFGNVITDNLLDPFPAVGKKSSTTIAFPTMVNSIYRTSPAVKTFQDGVFSGALGPKIYADLKGDGVNMLFQTRMLIACPLGVATYAVLPHIVAGEARYYLSNRNSPGKNHAMWYLMGGFQYAIKVVYTDATSLTTYYLCSATGGFDTLTDNTKTIAYFTVQYGPICQSTAGAGGPASPSTLVPGAWPISRAAYLALNSRTPNAPLVNDTYWESTARDPHVFSISSHADLIPSGASRDICAGLSLLTSNRSSALNRGGTIATAFVESEALIVPDVDNYSAIIKRNNDAKETDGKLGSYAWWMPTNLRHFDSTDVDLLKSGISTPAEQENFLISIVRPTDDGDDFKTFVTYVSNYKTSSRLHATRCQPGYKLTPDLLCMLQMVPSVTDNPDHKSIFGSLWGALKSFTTRQIANPDNWTKLGSFVTSLL